MALLLGGAALQAIQLGTECGPLTGPGRTLEPRPGEPLSKVDALTAVPASSTVQDSASYSRRHIVTTMTGTRTYKIDKSHSEAIFQVRHLLTKVRGRFTDFEGAIEFNDSAPEQSNVHFTITAKSIDTAEADRDTHLRSADFFDIDKYPQITFV